MLMCNLDGPWAGIDTACKAAAEMIEVDGPILETNGTKA